MSKPVKKTPVKTSAKLTKKQAADIAASAPPGLSAEYDEQQLWGQRTKLPITKDTPTVIACCNVHRNTCIRVLVGRKKTAYIQMDAAGLHVQRCGHDAFNAEWFELVEYTAQIAARVFLNSMAATYYISEEARTLLEEISNSGATTTTIKENDMSKVTTVKSSTTTAKAKGSATPPKTTSKASKPVAKAAAPAKPTAKSAKPAAKSSKSSKPSYAGQSIKALFKVDEVAAREGSWTRFMILAALKAATAEAAQKTVDNSKEFAGRKVDFGWLVGKGYISMK